MPGKAPARCRNLGIAPRVVTGVRTFFIPVLSAAIVLAAGAANEPRTATWTIDSIERRALIFAPESAETGEAGPPLVFGFHGHGGTMANAARTFRFHELWPEAVVVYMQGLPTVGQLTDPEGRRSGWQASIGDYGDRDLKFFDAVLQTMREDFEIDARRIHASGHSNGGGFTYLLWAAHPGLFAAIAPSAAGGRAVREGRPLPAMHIAGENDSLVKFALQQRVMETVRRINGCEMTPVEWGEGCLLYPSPGGTPFVSYIHPGTHKYPDDAPRLIVRFFRENPKLRAP